MGLETGAQQHTHAGNRNVALDDLRRRHAGRLNVGKSTDGSGGRRGLGGQGGIHSVEDGFRRAQGKGENRIAAPRTCPWRRNLALVIMPRVPSEPRKRLVRL